MPKIDDYKQALELSKKELSGRSPDLVASYSGALVDRDNLGDQSILLTFFNNETVISWPDFTFAYRRIDGGPPLQQQILLLHYLNGAWNSGGPQITGEWVAFQDVPDGKFYLGAFQKRARDPLVRTFSSNPELMVSTAVRAYGAHPSDFGDHSVVIKALPLVRVALVLWEGDDEFPPEGNILFDKNITKIFSAEDIAWLAGLAVYPLIGMAKRIGECDD